MSEIWDEILTEMLGQSGFCVEHLEEVYRMGGRPRLDGRAAADIYLDCLISEWVEKCQFLLKCGVPIDTSHIERNMDAVATIKNIPPLSAIGVDFSANDAFIQAYMRHAAYQGSEGIPIALAQLARYHVKVNTQDFCDMLNRNNVPERFKVLDLMIAMGANINALDEEGCSPLHHAIDNKDIRLIEYLIDKGADSRIHEDFLTDNVAGCPAVVYAVCRTSPERLESFVSEVIALGCDPSATSVGDVMCDALGALFYRLAIDESLDFDTHISKDFINLLINNGCDINLPINISDHEYVTPVMQCLKQSGFSAAQTLIDCGADINIPIRIFDAKNESTREVHPLQYAVSMNDIHMIDFLERNHVSLDFNGCEDVSQWSGHPSTKAKVENLMVHAKSAPGKQRHPDCGIGL